MAARWKGPLCCSYFGEWGRAQGIHFRDSPGRARQIIMADRPVFCITHLKQNPAPCHTAYSMQMDASLPCTTILTYPITSSSKVEYLLTHAGGIHTAHWLTTDCQWPTAASAHVGAARPDSRVIQSKEGAPIAPCSARTAYFAKNKSTARVNRVS